MEKKEHPLLLQVAEVARLLHIGKTKCYQLVKTGELPSVWVGRKRLVPRSVLGPWIDARLGGAP